jgi:hypothetical protein
MSRRKRSRFDSKGGTFQLEYQQSYINKLLREKLPAKQKNSELKLKREATSTR